MLESYTCSPNQMTAHLVITKFKSYHSWKHAVGSKWLPSFDHLLYLMSVLLYLMSVYWYYILSIISSLNICATRGINLVQICHLKDMFLHLCSISNFKNTYIHKCPPPMSVVVIWEVTCSLTSLHLGKKTCSLFAYKISMKYILRTINNINMLFSFCFI